MDEGKISRILKTVRDDLLKNQSLEFLFDIYIELSVMKSELHKLVLFCVDNYERKHYFSLIELTISLQTVAKMKIREIFLTKRQNLKYDFEIEKEYLENELKEKTDHALLFQQFSKHILSNKQYSHINNLAQKCKELNLKATDYIRSNHIPDN